MTTNKDLKDGILPCPFCGNDDPADDGMPEASLGVCCGERGCPIEGVVFTRRDWNIRADLCTPAIADGVGAEWKQTVRDLYDMMHFGEHNTFNNPNLSKIVAFIEDRHQNYFLSPPQAATDEG